jgi:hypothetical protein
MSMQLGSAGNMFATPNPGNEALAWQEMAQRQQQLQAQLRSQQLQDQGQILQNQYNQGKLVEFNDSKDIRQQALKLALQNDEETLAAKRMENKWKPQLWEQEIATSKTHQDDALDAIKMRKQALELDKNRFELTKREVDEHLKDMEVDRRFKEIQRPKLLEQANLNLDQLRQQLEVGAQEKLLNSKKLAGFDVDTAIGRLQALHSFDPAAREGIKSAFPEYFKDVPTNFTDDGVKKLGILMMGRKHFEPTDMEKAMGRIDPTKLTMGAKLDKAIAELLSDQATDKTPVKKKSTIDEAVSRLGVMFTKQEKKDAGIQSSRAPAANADIVDRLDYHFSQHKADSNKKYLEVANKDPLGREAFQDEPTEGSPLSNRVDRTNWKRTASSPFSKSMAVEYVDKTLPKDVRADFEYAVGNSAGTDGTVKQVTMFRTLIAELADALKSGDKESGKEIIDKYELKFGTNALTDKQKKALSNLSYKFGWSD